MKKTIETNETNKNEKFVELNKETMQSTNGGRTVNVTGSRLEAAFRGFTQGIAGSRSCSW